MHKSIFITLFFVTLIFAEDHHRNDDDDGYSYYKFRGPVSGEIRRIPVQKYRNGPQSVDYVARPDYGFLYEVHDPKTGNSQAHQETRNGNAVHGEYKVLQADGLIRTVKYVADEKSGFRATVTYEKA